MHVVLRPPLPEIATQGGQLTHELGGLLIKRVPTRRRAKYGDAQVAGIVEVGVVLGGTTVEEGESGEVGLLTCVEQRAVEGSP